MLARPRSGEKFVPKRQVSRQEGPIRNEYELMMTEDKAEFLLVLLVMAGLALLRDALKPLWKGSDTGAGWDQELYVLVLISGCCMVFIPLIDALAPWFEFADFHFNADLAWVGLTIGLLAVGLCWQALSDKPMGAAGEEGHSFRVRGVYCYIRHPFYAALLLLAMAQILLIQNWLGAAAAVLSFVLVYVLRVPRDELRALEKFGPSYLDYMARTGSLLPRIHRQRRD